MLGLFICFVNKKTPLITLYLVVIGGLLWHVWHLGDDPACAIIHDEGKVTISRGEAKVSCGSSVVIIDQNLADGWAEQYDVSLWKFRQKCGSFVEGTEEPDFGENGHLFIGIEWALKLQIRSRRSRVLPYLQQRSRTSA